MSIPLVTRYLTEKFIRVENERKSELKHVRKICTYLSTYFRIFIVIDSNFKSMELSELTF